MNRLFIILGIFICSLSVQASNDKLPQIVITTNNSAIITSDYVKGNIQITDVDGTVVELSAKFKTRGATALAYPQKPSLTLKLRDADGESIDSCLLGMRSCSKWLLDAMAIDRICMRNRVAMDIWNDYASLPYETSFPVTSETGKTIYRSGTIGKFVEVTINGQYEGIYCLSDHINQKLLNLKKADVDEETLKVTVRGVLYKNGTTDVKDQNNPAFNEDTTVCTVIWHSAWELKEPDDYPCKAAWEPLLDAMSSPLASGKAEKVTNYNLVKKYFFVDNLIDYQLHVMALSIVDNWGNKNHYFSIRNIQKDINDTDPTEAARRKFYVSPWDLDTSFGGSYNGTNYDGTYTEDWLPADITKNGGFFPFHYCQANEEYQSLLKERWAELRLTSYLPFNVNARLEAFRDLFINSGAWERNGQIQPCYVTDLAKEIKYIEEWYERRYAIMDSYFGTTTPSVKGDVNGDGIVDISDVNAIISIICGSASSSTKGEVNGDGTIDISDVNAVISIICGN